MTSNPLQPERPVEETNSRLEAGLGAESPPIQHRDDPSFLEALRNGDELAFASLLDQYHGRLLRLAMNFVRSHAVAEEVVQETWVGVLEGLSRFEGRSALKTWIFRILINQAKTWAVRENRTVPFSSTENPDGESWERAVDPSRFETEGPWIGHWASEPRSWDKNTPERLLLSKESRNLINKAIESLPPNQRLIIQLRDIEELDSKEICNILSINETNQRVLLHRARSKVREALEQYLEGGISQP